MSRRPSTPRAVAAALVAAVMLTVAGCAGGTAAATSSSGQAVDSVHVLRINPFEGFTLDAQTLNSTFQISDAVIEPLIRVSADGTALEPGLAASWDYNADSTALTVHLNPAATFSDGTPVTAKDVAFSVDTWKAGANYGATYSVIASTTVVDDHTITFTLAYPDTTLPNYLSWSIAGVIPANFGGRSKEAFWQSPVGAGAFTVSSWSTNGDVVLEKSPHYYRAGYPLLTQVVSSYASDVNSIGLQLKSGQADLADELQPVTAAALPAEMVKAQPEHLTPVLLMNTKDPALAQVKVRQAIGYAINYASVVASALKGYGKVPVGALPTNSGHWAAPSAPYFSYDQTKAAALLADTNAPGTLTFTYPNDPSSTLIAQIVQQNLQAVGITVQAHAQDSASEFASISAGDYQLGLFSYNAISPDVSDPAWYLAATSMMFTGLPTDTLVGQLTRYAGASDADKKTIVTAIQDELFTQVPFIALAHSQAIIAERSGLTGVNPTPWGTYYFDTVSATR